MGGRRDDVSDALIVEAVAQCKGFPSLVADKLGMSMVDLLDRAKASASVAHAFAEAKQRMVDRAKANVIKIMLGDVIRRTRRCRHCGRTFYTSEA